MPNNAEIGPMSERERAWADAYIRRNRSVGAGMLDALSRAGSRAGRITNQMLKSPIQSVKQLALAVADPEVSAQSVANMGAEELQRLERDGLANYLETAADRVVQGATALMQNPEAAGNALSTFGLAKLTRGAGFQNTNLDEAALATKAVSDAALENYAQGPEPWSDVLNLEQFAADYAAAKQRAREPGRALAPLWALADSVDRNLQQFDDLRRNRGLLAATTPPPSPTPLPVAPQAAPQAVDLDTSAMQFLGVPPQLHNQYLKSNAN